LNNLIKHSYGSPPVSDEECESNMDGQKNPCNINVVADELTNIFTHYKEEINNEQKEYFEKSKKIANMKVYLDLSKDMEYTPIYYDENEIEILAPLDSYKPMDIGGSKKKKKRTHKKKHNLKKSKKINKKSKKTFKKRHSK
jgi:hypothetical protein